MADKIGDNPAGDREHEPRTERWQPGSFDELHERITDAAARLADPQEGETTSDTLTWYPAAGASAACDILTAQEAGQLQLVVTVFDPSRMCKRVLGDALSMRMYADIPDKIPKGTTVAGVTQLTVRIPVPAEFDSLGDNEDPPVSFSVRIDGSDTEVTRANYAVAGSLLERMGLYQRPGLATRVGRALLTYLAKTGRGLDPEAHAYGWEGGYPHRIRREEPF